MSFTVISSRVSAKVYGCIFAVTTSMHHFLIFSLNHIFVVISHYRIGFIGKVNEAARLIYACLARLNGLKMDITIDSAYSKPSPGYRVFYVYKKKNMMEMTPLDVAAPDSVLDYEDGFRIIIRYRKYKRGWGWSDIFDLYFSYSGEDFIDVFVERVGGIAGRIHVTGLLELIIYQHKFLRIGFDNVSIFLL